MACRLSGFETCWSLGKKTGKGVYSFFGGGGGMQHSADYWPDCAGSSLASMLGSGARGCLQQLRLLGAPAAAPGAAHGGAFEWCHQYLGF